MIKSKLKSPPQPHVHIWTMLKQKTETSHRPETLRNYWALTNDEKWFLDLLRRKEDRGGGSERTELRRLRRRSTAAGSMTEELMCSSVSTLQRLNVRRLSADRLWLWRDSQEDSPQLPLYCSLRSGGGGERRLRHHHQRSRSLPFYRQVTDAAVYWLKQTFSTDTYSSQTTASYDEMLLLVLHKWK